MQAFWFYGTGMFLTRKVGEYYQKELAKHNIHSHYIFRKSKLHYFTSFTLLIDFTCLEFCLVNLPV